MQTNGINVSSDEGIDLFALVRSMLMQRWLIVCVTVLVVLCAAAYAFFSKPVYETKVSIIPPTQNGIAELNYGRGNISGLDIYSIDYVYGVFTRSLQSESLRQVFFNDVYLPSLSESERKVALDRLYQRFSNELVIKGPSKDAPDRFSVTVQGRDPQQVTEWAKSYVKRANEAAESELVKNVTAEAAVKARNLEQRIISLRENALRVRGDRIQQLREALKIAESIGLKTPVVSSSAGVDITVDTSEKMDYQRGSKALTAEVLALETRPSDDAFIPELRELQMRYNFYRALNVDPERMSIYRQDGSINVPESPIKPRKGLVLVFGLVLGLVLGFVIAIIRFILIRAELGK